MISAREYIVHLFENIDEKRTSCGEAYRPIPTGLVPRTEIKLCENCRFLATTAAIVKRKPKRKE